MATPKLTSQGTWRVQIMVAGVRAGGTFSTKEEADKWASAKTTSLLRKETLRSVKASDMLVNNVPKKLVQALQDAPYTKAEIMAAALPANRTSGVYFLMLDDEVVYVGQSVDVLGRISRHKRDGKEFDSFSYILCEEGDLNRLEALYITVLMPWLNFTLGRVPRNIDAPQP